MLEISYKHETHEDGSVKLCDYRCVDTVTGEALCEMIDTDLVWNIEPDEFVYAVVENEFEKVQRDWFLEQYGLKKVFGDFPQMSLEEQMSRENGWLEAEEMLEPIWDK